MGFSTRNPYTNQILENYTIHSSTDIENTITKAHETFLRFRHKKPESRKVKMKNLAELLRVNKQKYAKQITLEMGKPISQSIAEIEKCAVVCDYYADLAEVFLKDKIVETDASKSYISFEPLGVIFGIMPWNYPFWQVFRVLAPNLMLGNGIIIKHAPNVLGCAKMIEDLVLEARFKPFSFSCLIIETEEVESIINHKLIKGVTFTGSTNAGREVASLAGKAIKKSVLELGGNNALVVFKDANLKKTVEICVKARFQNTGQSCIAGKRLIIHESIYKDFLKRLTLAVKKLNIGNPDHKDTYISILARKDLAENLKIQLNKSLEMGANLILGGKQDSCFFEPTLVENVTQDMPIFKEETFGPVLAISSYKEENELLDLINQSEYGLGVSLFTSNIKGISHLIPQIEDGAVFINSLVKSDPKLPFGGTKNSGYGRELGKQGLIEFANIKTIYIQ